MIRIFRNGGNYAAIINGRRFEGGLREVQDAIDRASGKDVPIRKKHACKGVKCPGCGRKKAVIPNGEIWHCTGCHAEFDDDPGEGGDYFEDPTRSISLDRM